MTKAKIKVWCNALPIVAGAFYAMNLIGAWLFMLVEGAQRISYMDSVYWAFITSLSVGYGDISPATEAGQILAIVMAKVVLLVIIPLIVVRMMDQLYEDKHQFSDDEQKLVMTKLDLLLLDKGIDPSTVKAGN